MTEISFIYETNCKCILSCFLYSEVVLPLSSDMRQILHHITEDTDLCINSVRLILRIASVVLFVLSLTLNITLGRATRVIYHQCWSNSQFPNTKREPLSCIKQWHDSKAQTTLNLNFSNSRIFIYIFFSINYRILRCNSFNAS